MTTIEDRTDQDVTGVASADGGNPAADENLLDDRASQTRATERALAVRTTTALAFTVSAAGLMVGAIFLGAAPRFTAVVCGILGLAIALMASRARGPVSANFLIVFGLLGIGIVAVIPAGVSNIGQLQQIVASARAAGDVLRPPVPFTPGWHAIIGWVMALAGFGSGWLALEFRRPMTGLVLPLPLAAVAAISVPEDQQVVSGAAVLVLFAVGLGVLSSSRAFGDSDERPSVAFQARKVVRALPTILVVATALFGLARANVLFPAPRIDPTNEPQKPRTVPLSKVPDRVLFEVEAGFTGPWRIGGLDVYDGVDWRLPPFNQNQLADVPRNGTVDDELEPGVKAAFTIKGLTGAVLPGLPNPVGIVAKGPKLAYDARSGNIRTVEGEVTNGLEYSVVAGALPTPAELRQAPRSVPVDLSQFTEVPPPPPAVVALIAAAPKTSQWDEFNYLRLWVLDNVTVTGTGQPGPVPPTRVEEIIGTTKEASPFEIVATQALLARWIGLPSRIGYGFDGGERVGDALEVRPRHGATFVEVWFSGYKWLPVIGTPKKAKATLGNTEQQQQNSAVAPSEDIGVRVYLPEIVAAQSPFIKQVKATLAVVVPVAVLAGLTYVLYPLWAKSRARGRRRVAARRSGPRARVALAYAEWRDTAADFGYRFPADTPIWFLSRFLPDQEHREFAWLATRVLWGDLADEVDDHLATIAEELSRTMRRRLALAHPATLRAVASVSRISMRYPYVIDRSRRVHTDADLDALKELTNAR